MCFYPQKTHVMEKIEDLKRKIEIINTKLHYVELHTKLLDARIDAISENIDKR